MRQHVKKLLGKIRQAAKEKRIAKFRKRFAEAYPDGEAFAGSVIKGEPYGKKDLFFLNGNFFAEGDLGGK